MLKKLKLGQKKLFSYEKKRVFDSQGWLKI